MLEIKTVKRYVYIKTNVIEEIKEYYIAANWTERSYLSASKNLFEDIRYKRHYMTEKKSDILFFTNKDDAQFIIDFIGKYQIQKKSLEDKIL